MMISSCDTFKGALEKAKTELQDQLDKLSDYLQIYMPRTGLVDNNISK